jgi:hypothetical protein
MLSPLDLQLQEDILLRVHKWSTIEEAIYFELKFDGCMTYYKKHDEIGFHWPTYDDDIDTILWLPSCLARVLYALCDHWEIDWAIYSTDSWGNIREYICDRKLLNDDGTPATLRDQSEETKQSIATELLISQTNQFS